MIVKLAPSLARLLGRRPPPPVGHAAPDGRETLVRSLTAPGAPFEMQTVDVQGAPVRMFVQRPQRLTDLLAGSLAYPDRECVVSADGTRLSYAEFVERAASFAAGLQSRAGLRTGDRVGILAANRTEWMIAMWAILHAGGVVVALNGWWTADEISDALRRSDCRILIGDAKRLARLDDGALPAVTITMDPPTRGRETPFTDFLTAERPTPVDVREDDLAAIMFTSGTTGRPNGVRISHRAWIAGLMNMKAATVLAVGNEPELASIDTGVRVLASLPFFHVGGGHGTVIGAIAGGATVILPPEKFDPSATLALIERERVTRWSAVPSMVRAVCLHPEAAHHDLGSVSNIGYGAAPSGPDLLAMARATFPGMKAASNAYGLTEAGSIFTMNTGADFVSHPESVGRPFLTVELRVVDDDDRELPPGETGLVQVRGPFLMDGYLDGDDSELFADGRWLRTGDIGRVDQDGFVYLVDRKKDVIIRGGENIFAGEVERRIEAHPSVAEAAVVAAPSERLGEEVRAVIRLRPGQTLPAEAVQAWVRETLAPFKAPSIVEFVTDPLPRNAAGKLMKNVIKASR